MKLVSKIALIVVMLLRINSTKATEGLFANEPKVVKFISCYPNPATSNINFDFANYLDKGYTLAIYNCIGKKVDEVNLISSRTNLSLENYFRGLYIYQLRNKQGNLIESGKFQVVK